jgi:hypothetical protein
MWGTFFQPALWLTLGRYLIVIGAVVVVAAIALRLFRGWCYEARLFVRSIVRLLLVCLLIFAGVQFARILGFFDAETLVASVFMFLSALLAVYSLVRTKTPDRMMRIVVPVGIMCVGGAAIIWARQWSGYIAAGGFFLFVIAPGWLGRLARRLTELGHVRAGGFFARIAWLLHPSTRTPTRSRIT